MLFFGDLLRKKKRGNLSTLAVVECASSRSAVEISEMLPRGIPTLDEGLLSLPISVEPTSEPQSVDDDERELVGLAGSGLESAFSTALGANDNCALDSGSALVFKVSKTGMRPLDGSLGRPRSSFLTKVRRLANDFTPLGGDGSFDSSDWT